MRFSDSKFSCFKVLISFLMLLAAASCSSWKVQPELVGKWKTDKFIAVVRTEPTKFKFEVASDSTKISLSINGDNTVTGFIGTAEIKGGTIDQNKGIEPPLKKGISYVIDCGSVGKIFTNDPIDGKQIQLWLRPIKEDGTIEADMRLFQGYSVFPMATLTLKKVKD